jgi:predicted outer membrane repeat protein
MNGVNLFGGAVYLASRSATFDTCNFLGNSASFGGAIIAMDSVRDLVIRNSLFQGNEYAPLF